MTHMAKKKDAKKILVRKREWKSLRIPTRRREDDIKMNLEVRRAWAGLI